MRNLFNNFSVKTYFNLIINSFIYYAIPRIF